jgi:ElaB/YqjD/DUF883 family membrane-anchored ribosome-binding protein
MATNYATQSKKNGSLAASGLHDLIENAEELLESVKDLDGAAAEKVRESVSKTVQDARARLSELDVPEMASDAIDNTVGFVRRDPWRAVAIAALAVLAISTLVRRGSEG